MDHNQNCTQFAAQIVAAYVAHNPVNATELPRLIQQTLAALSSKDGPERAVQQEPQKPAVPIKKSLTQEHITCLEDGKHFKSLKRHLRTDHNLSPHEYRAKWGLPKDYPMVAPLYSEARSNMAREAGLGQMRKQRTTRAA